MTLRDRILALKQNGYFDDQAVAALLDLDSADVVRVLSEPSYDPPVPGGSGASVAGYPPAAGDNGFAQGSIAGGGPMRFCEDLIRRNLAVTWVRYESLVTDPAAVVKRVHGAIGCEPYGHDYDNVENVASDLDALYRNKFPHDASGAVRPNGKTWTDTLDPELGALIAGRYPLFMQTFAYEV